MSSRDIDVAHVAHLARLALTPEEAKALAPQLREVLRYVEQLEQLDVTGVEPMAHAVPRVNVSRPDVCHPSLTQEEALRNAPASAQGLFLVPRIVE